MPFPRPPLDPGAPITIVVPERLTGITEVVTGSNLVLFSQFCQLAPWQAVVLPES